MLHRDDEFPFSSTTLNTYCTDVKSVQDCDKFIEGRKYWRYCLPMTLQVIYR